MTERAGLLLLDGALRRGRVRLEAGRIASVEEEPALAGDLPVVAPGLLDLHVHGFGGCDPLEDLAGMARALARCGTTAFQPTLFPRAPDRLGDEASRVWAAASALGVGCARAVGLHLEGPFVNPRAAGALPVEDLAEPSPSGLRAILGPATGDGRGVRTVTLAPELPGAPALIEELVCSGVRVSLGHSRATAEEARTAAAAGARGATHLYNAMSGVHHRDPGLAAFALTDDALHAELIGDLVHVGERAIDLALRARGPRGLCLVSDALIGAGTGCDVFAWHGREHQVRGGAAFYPARDGSAPVLAGSATGQLEQVRRLVRAGVVSLADALTMATEAPARALCLDDELGVLAPGRRADLVILDPVTLALREVLIAGAPL
jgi:N-acetylglucosamine-6-phosphate deacetylase